MMSVAGVDGCNGGWVVVHAELDGCRLVPVGCTKAGTFAHVLRLTAGEAIVAVDMPIGLPDVAVVGGRACDRAARAALGPVRGTSVFPAPTRGALGAGDYRVALAVQRAGGGPGLSRQAWELGPKLREVDAALTPTLQERVREAHPELSFMALAGAPVTARKRRPDGFALRRELLHGHGFDVPGDWIDARPRGAAPDDVLDACAVAVTAARIARGEAGRFPPLGEAAPRDGRGLAMEIWF